MEKGKWIFLVDKLPTEVAPPAMSIHYAIPWPMVPSKLGKSAIARLNKIRNAIIESGLADEYEVEDMSPQQLASLVLSDMELYEYLEEKDDDEVLATDSSDLIKTIVMTVNKKNNIHRVCGYSNGVEELNFPDYKTIFEGAKL